MYVIILIMRGLVVAAATHDCFPPECDFLIFHTVVAQPNITTGLGRRWRSRGISNGSACGNRGRVNIIMLRYGCEKTCWKSLDKINNNEIKISYDIYGYRSNVFAAYII